MQGLFDIPVHSEYKAVKHKIKNFTIEGLSSKSPFVPYYSAFVNKNIYNRQVINYSIPDDEKIRYMYGWSKKSYRKLYYMLCHGTVPKHFSTLREDEYPLFVMKGLIFDLNTSQPNIHFLVAVEKDYMIPLFRDKLPIEYHKICIFVSEEFVNGMYSRIYKKISTDIINPLIRKGVNLMITNNIANWCYRNNLTEPDFPGFLERSEFLNNFNKTLWKDMEE